MDTPCIYTGIFLGAAAATTPTRVGDIRRVQTEGKQRHIACRKGKSMKKTLAVLFLLILAGCMKEAPQKLAAEKPDAGATQAEPAEPAKPKMKPETFVQFPKSAIACATKDDLQEATLHILNGEKTKGAAMFDGDSRRCVMLNSEGTYKILSVHYDSGTMSEIGIMEIVRKESKSASGVWAFTMGAVAADSD